MAARSVTLHRTLFWHFALRSPTGRIIPPTEYKLRGRTFAYFFFCCSLLEYYADWISCRTLLTCFLFLPNHDTCICHSSHRVSFLLVSAAGNNAHNAFVLFSFLLGVRGAHALCFHCLRQVWRIFVPAPQCTIDFMTKVPLRIFHMIVFPSIPGQVQAAG